jgi:Na+-driven multidrug efflux pump
MAMLTSAFSSSNAALVGQNFAAGKQKRATQVVWYSWGICVALGLFFAIIFLAVPEVIFRCFTDDPEVLALAPSFLRTCIVMVMAFALMSPVIGFVNGVGNSTLNMVIGILDGVFGRVGLSLLFGHVLNWGLNGYYLGNGLAGYISVIGCSVYFFSGRWKKRTLLTQSSQTLTQDK